MPDDGARVGAGPGADFEHTLALEIQPAQQLSDMRLKLVAVLLDFGEIRFREQFALARVGITRLCIPELLYLCLLFFAVCSGH